MWHGISSRKMQCDQSHQIKENNFLNIYSERPHFWLGRLHTVPWSGTSFSPACPGIATWTWLSRKQTALGFLPRSLRISNEQTKTAAYFSVVRPIIEYCSTVWNPHTKEYINKVEMVQPRAARYVTNRYHNTSSATSMLEHLEWASLDSWRAKNQLTMLFKIIHGIGDIPACYYLVPASTRTWPQHSLKFYQIPASSDYYKFSFFTRTIRHWNSLPASVADWSSQFGILQTGALLFVNINYPAWPCKYTLVISLSYAVVDFVCPGGGLKSENALAKSFSKLLVFSWLSITRRITCIIATWHKHWNRI